MVDVRNPKFRLNCAVVVKKGNKILLGVRAKDPDRGTWVIPGGGVEFLEPIRETAKREIKEETGLDVEVKDLITIYEIIMPPETHRVILFWWGEYRRGRLMPSSDLSDAKFLTRAQVRTLVARKKTRKSTTDILRIIGWV